MGFLPNSEAVKAREVGGGSRGVGKDVCVKNNLYK